MPRYRVEISARALGWLEDVEAPDEETAVEIARLEWASADFDQFQSPEIEGVEEEEDDA